MSSDEQPTKRKPFPWQCHRCGNRTVEPAVVAYSLEMTHDGEAHRITVPELKIPKCTTCGELVFTDAADDQITGAMRTELGLLLPRQITANRTALRLSIEEFARRLGITGESLIHLESNQRIQSRALDNLMRCFFGLAEVRAVLVGPLQDPAFGSHV